MNTTDMKFLRRVARVAGAMDLATGLGLMFAPGWTLGWMGVATPGAEALVFLRWIGAFVGAVGACYLVAAARSGESALREALRFTLLLRLAAGGYCAAAVIGGALTLPWIVVAVTDLSLAGLQAFWLRGWRAES